jgi:hypothetical protein
MDFDRFWTSQLNRLNAIDSKISHLRVDHDKLSARYGIAAGRLAAMEQSEFLEQQRRHLGETFKHASSYANVIVLAGYAAFFALWTSAQAYLHPQLASLTALLMTVSCSIFVLWTVGGMVLTATSLAGYDEALSDSDPQEAHRRHEIKRIATQSTMIKPWARALRWTLCPALLAVGMLAGGFLYGAVAPSILEWL